MDKNIMCENCIHKDVCKYKDEIAGIQRLIENFPYVVAPMLKCTKFLDRNVIYSTRSNAE